MMVTGASACTFDQIGQWAGPHQLLDRRIREGERGRAHQSGGCQNGTAGGTNSRREMRKGNPLLVRPDRRSGSLNGELWQCRVPCRHALVTFRLTRSAPWFPILPECSLDPARERRQLVGIGAHRAAR